MQKPSILIIHGCWHLPEAYQDLIDGLHEAGHEVTCPSLPTCSKTSPSRNDDVALVRDVLGHLLDAGKTVVVVAHSYGGLVAAEAVEEQHAVTHRAQAGLPGGVAKIVFLSCFVLAPGGTLLSMVEASGGTKLKLDVDSNLIGRPLNPAFAFYNGVESQAKVDAAVSALVECNMQASWAPAPEGRKLGWAVVPCSYIYCDLDNTILIECQRNMTKLIAGLGAMLDQGHVLKTGHSPWLSQLDECLRVIKAAASL